MDDFRGELREFRDEDCGEPRAVGALVGDKAARAADRLGLVVGVDGDAEDDHF